MQKKSAGQLKRILEQVVTKGTGTKAKGLPGKSGGKTGTI